MERILERKGRGGGKGKNRLMDGVVGTSKHAVPVLQGLVSR